jgi:hypothetical protein
LFLEYCINLSPFYLVLAGMSIAFPDLEFIITVVEFNKELFVTGSNLKS